MLRDILIYSVFLLSVVSFFGLGGRVRRFVGELY